MATTPPNNSQMETVSGTAAAAGSARAVASANKVQVSLLLNEFSNKVTGSVDASVQQSSDGQNWQQIGIVSALFDKAGTLQTGVFPVTARFYRVVMTSSPADNTVSFALDATLSDQ